MKLVLDASAAVFHVMESLPGSVIEAEEILAPDVFVAEVTNAAWKLASFGNVSARDSESILSEALQLPNAFVPSKILCNHAFHLGLAEKHAVYDLFYLVLARQENAILFTRDKALKRLAHRHGVQTI